MTFDNILLLQRRAPRLYVNAPFDTKRLTYREFVCISTGLQHDEVSATRKVVPCTASTGGTVHRVDLGGIRL